MPEFSASVYVLLAYTVYLIVGFGAAIICCLFSICLQKDSPPEERRSARAIIVSVLILCVAGVYAFYNQVPYGRYEPPTQVATEE